MIKTLSKLGIKSNVFPDKLNIQKLHSQHHTKWLKTERFPLRTGKDKNVHVYHFYLTFTVYASQGN